MPDLDLLLRLWPIAAGLAAAALALGRVALRHARLTDEVRALSRALAELRSELDRVEAKAATRDDVAKLDAKLSRVHERLDDMPGRVVDLLRLTFGIRDGARP